MQSVLITPEGIQKNLKSIKPLDAICEYIWNGFDAGASEIHIVLHENNFGIINKISIEDNGIGIDYDELKWKFQPFNDSKKSIGENKNNHTLPHGKKGIGRLTFFAFAQNACWETTYIKDETHYHYYIEMHKESLNRFDDNGGQKPEKTTAQMGTKVTFTQIDTIDKRELIAKIKENFFWFLELNESKKFHIYVNDELIKYDDLIIKKQQLNISEKKVKNEYEIKFLHWKTKLGNEFSRIYYIGSDDKERYKETTRLNNQSDEFYHSVFIKSSYFDNFHFGKSILEGQRDLFSSKNDDEYKVLMDSINRFLISYRQTYLKEASNKYIAKLIDKNLYPEFDDSVIGKYQKEELDNLVGTLYVAQPKIFVGLQDENKKITLQLLKLIMDNGNKPDLFNVLRQVIDLNETELEELSSILQYTSLNHITRTIKLLCDRQKVIQVLKELVITKEFNAYEVPHIQKIVEENYWIFGEQYHLITAAEPDFKRALQGLIMAQTGRNEKVDLEHPDKNKEMDIFMIRQNRSGQVTQNVVVELKRPKVKIGEEEVSQVKRYLRVIKSHRRFNAGNVQWIFYLVGAEFDNTKYIEGEIENSSNHGEKHLIYWRDNGLTKIYALKWSEIFDNYSKRHEFLMERLQLEEKIWIEKHESADDAVKSVEDNSAKAQRALIPKSNKHKEVVL